MNTLEEIKARVEAATEGPWDVHSDRHEYRGGDYMQVQPERGTRTICDITDVHKGNAEFIAHARTDVPKLIAALEAVMELTRQWHEKRSSNPSEASDIRDWAACDIEEEIAEALS